MNASPFREFLRSCYKNVSFMLGFIMLLSVVIIALFAPQIAPYNFEGGDPNAKFTAPCAQHIMGTDNMGRDLFSRIVYGSRITLKVALIGGTIQLFLGVVVGLFCGFYGGVVDRFMLFFADLTWCVPGMVMALAVVTVIGSTLSTVSRVV